MQRVGITVVAAALGAVAALAGCNDDGRTMRPAKPEQTSSVSTTAPITEPSLPPDGFAGGFDIPVTTLAPTTFPTVVDARLVVPWAEGGPVDPRYTCDGPNVSPELSWTAVPEGTVEIAVALTDDDAPDFVHWIVAKIDPLSTILLDATVPEFAIQGTNSGGTAGYTGPCPPEGETHTYHYTVFFLGQETTLADEAPGEDLLAEVRARAFDSASVGATYSRP